VNGFTKTRCRDRRERTFKNGLHEHTTWADSEDAATTKIQNYLELLDWHVVSVEQARALDEDKKYGEWRLIGSKEGVTIQRQSFVEHFILTKRTNPAAIL
jgi:hypothetical protein